MLERLAGGTAMRGARDHCQINNAKAERSENTMAERTLQ